MVVNEWEFQNLNRISTAKFVCIRQVQYICCKLNYIFFQISDYPDTYCQCSVEDQKLLAIFTVNTGPYCRPQFGYRKRTVPVKLNIQLPLVEERLQLIVRISTYSCYCFKILSKLLSKLFYVDRLPRNKLIQFKNCLLTVCLYVVLGRWIQEAETLSYI